MQKVSLHIMLKLGELFQSKYNFHLKKIAHITKTDIMFNPNKIQKQPLIY